jgi:mannose-6-phosphate isomerase-like protein (cupin superfamily)
MRFMGIRPFVAISVRVGRARGGLDGHSTHVAGIHTCVQARRDAGPARPGKMRSMSRFAIVNLEDVEDSTGGRAPGVEGRFARRHLDSEHLGVSLFRYEPGYRGSTGHRHREQEEAYVVIGGSGRILLDDEVRDLRRWDVVRVSPAVVRAFEAGPEGLEVIAVGADRPEGGDGERAEAHWPE